MLKQQVADNIRGLSKAPDIGASFLEMFETLCADCKQNDLPSSAVIATMYTEDSKLEPGDFAPEIHFVVRRVADD